MVRFKDRRKSQLVGEEAVSFGETNTPLKHCPSDSL